MIATIQLVVIIQMGTNGSRIIDVKNVDDHIDQCRTLSQRQCHIYGDLTCVRYKGMDFNIAASQTCQPPHPSSIHYLVMPNYLLFPDFTLLEDLCPSSLPDLLSIISGICEMALEGGPVGIGHNRVAYKDRWGVVGEFQTNWPYMQVLQGGVTQGVFFSPQQMIALSQGKVSPRYDASKADVFALGIMLVEVIFKDDLGVIYDYQNFQIRLNPLLEKLQDIKENFGNDVVSLFVGMLEIEEEDRYNFQDIYDIVSDLLAPPPSRPSLHMLNSNGSQRNMELSKGNRPNLPYNRTPKPTERGQYRNDVSPFRGRFATNVNSASGNPRRTPERAHESRSPMRRQHGQHAPQTNYGARQDFQSFSQRVSPRPGR